MLPCLRAEACYTSVNVKVYIKLHIVVFSFPIEIGVLFFKGSLIVADDWGESCVVVGTLVVSVVPAADAAHKRGLWVHHHVGVVQVVSNIFHLFTDFAVAGDCDDPEVVRIDLVVDRQVTHEGEPALVILVLFNIVCRRLSGGIEWLQLVNTLVNSIRDSPFEAVVMEFCSVSLESFQDGGSA